MRGHRTLKLLLTSGLLTIAVAGCSTPQSTMPAPSSSNVPTMTIRDFLSEGRGGLTTITGVMFAPSPARGGGCQFTIDGIKCITHSTLPTGALDGARIAARTVGSGSEAMVVDQVRVLAAPFGQAARDALAEHGLVLQQVGAFAWYEAGHPLTFFQLQGVKSTYIGQLWMSDAREGLRSNSVTASIKAESDQAGGLRVYQYRGLTIVLHTDGLSASQLAGFDAALGPPVARN